MGSNLLSTFTKVLYIKIIRKLWLEISVEIPLDNAVLYSALFSAV